MKEKIYKLKGHHVLISVMVIFLTLALMLSFVRSLNDSAKQFRSQYMSSDILQRLSKIVPQRLIDRNIDFLNHTPPEQIGKMYLVIFKQEGEVELWLPDQSAFAIFDVEMISSGFGLKNKPTESVFPEGIFEIKDVGLNDKTGYFVQIKYPSDKALSDQKIQGHEFKHDAILITKNPIYPSFLSLDEDSLEDLVYLFLKFGHQNAEVVVFPKRPPLSMEINGTQVLAEIYLQLGQLYNELSGALYESK